MADEVERIQRQIEELQSRLQAILKEKSAATQQSWQCPPYPELSQLQQSSLSRNEIARYGRQLIIDGFGSEGQKSLKSTSVLIVGAGGLGSPSALYLAGAGIGRIGLVDYDDVEIHNLHRQIIHREQDCGRRKAESARDAVLRLNSSIECIAYTTLLSTTNALEIFKHYDIVLDCTDNAVTRYLINDACVLLGKPLVSGAAIRTEGQLTVYNYGPDCPCYRCLFPQPPPHEAQGNCSDQGVIGPVPGVIGVLQAMEAIKIATKTPGVLAGRLLLYDAQTATFRNIKLRQRNPSCAVCGKEPTIKELINYEQFCGSRADDKPTLEKFIDDDLSVSPKAYFSVVESNTPHVLLDVRPRVQFNICHIPNAVSTQLSAQLSIKVAPPNPTYSDIPLNELEDSWEYFVQSHNAMELPVYVICRRGNDSQLATEFLLRRGVKFVRNIAGGLVRWVADVDSDFPVY